MDRICGDAVRSHGTNGARCAEPVEYGCHADRFFGVLLYVGGIGPSWQMDDFSFIDLRYPSERKLRWDCIRRRRSGYGKGRRRIDDGRNRGLTRRVLSKVEPRRFMSIGIPMLLEGLATGWQQHGR